MQSVGRISELKHFRLFFQEGLFLSGPSPSGELKREWERWMGHEFVASHPGQEAPLEPNYWLMGLAAAPTFLVVVLELAVVVLALTDRGLAMWARYSWALIAPSHSS
jgi:hypothetical protein